MNLEYFKSNLNKGQLEAIAIDTVRKHLESVDPLEALVFAKKLKFFADKLTTEAEKEAKHVWEQHKDAYPNCTYTNGGFLLDYSGDPVYSEIQDKLKERKELLDMAFKHKEIIFDSEGAEVPKVKIKSYRKDSINVKL